MKAELQFRLNGFDVPEIRIQRALIHGEPAGELQVAINDRIVGWFTLSDDDLSPSAFRLEYRKVADARSGWRIVLSCQHLLKLLALNGHLR